MLSWKDKNLEKDMTAKYLFLLAGSKINLTLLLIADQEKENHCLQIPIKQTFDLTCLQIQTFDTISENPDIW